MRGKFYVLKILPYFFNLKHLWKICKIRRFLLAIPYFATLSSTTNFYFLRKIAKKRFVTEKLICLANSMTWKFSSFLRIERTYEWCLKIVKIPFVIGYNLFCPLYHERKKLDKEANLRGKFYDLKICFIFKNWKNVRMVFKNCKNTICDSI